MIDTFNIYDIPEGETFKDVSDDDAVEIGLSPGELRQSILDRFNMEVDNGEFDTVNECLESFDMHIVESLFKNESGRKQAKKDIEEFLYYLEDADYANTYWNFTDELIYIEGLDSDNN